MNGSREHGGGLDAAAARWHWPRKDWLDLSTGINPEPYPLPLLPAAVWSRLPDAGVEQRLRHAAAVHYGTAGPALVA